MKRIPSRFFLALLFLLSISLGILGCATLAPTTAPESGDRQTIPVKVANLEAVIEQNEGLEVDWDDAKEVRDLYRGGVQQKAKGEKSYKEKAYSKALQSYQTSNDFFSKLLTYWNEDAAELILFEDTSILFLPNLLLADNHYKMGLIYRQMGKENSARRSWKHALSFTQKSLRCERTEWGLGLQKDVLSLLPTP